ncbi:MAG: DNA polymerase Y family protein [bacterium]
MDASPPLERIACADLPALPLQLVLRAHPEWREDPVVVVEDDRPLAAVLWANRAARAQRIVRGIRFGEAQSLAARVHAAIVPAGEIERATREVLATLLELSPSVEPSQERPGVFWLDPNGLEHLHESLERWAACVHQRLDALGLTASVVVGWHPFRALAVARSRQGPHVLASADVERAEAARVPLARLAEWKLVEALHVLGVETLGDLLRLPRGELRDRYGEEAASLHDLASGRAWTPFRPERLAEPIHIEIPVEPPDDDPARLLFGMKGALHPVLEETAARGRGVSALAITLELDHAPACFQRIEAASPTLDVVRLLDLVRLRLAALHLSAPVERVCLVLETRPLHVKQASLLPERTSRDRVAASRAFARLAAAFGEGAVARARLVDAHLPEARFLWEPLRELEDPAPPSLEGEILPLARNLLAPPAPLPDPPRHEAETWLGRFGAVLGMHGPGRVGSGWWDRETERDYFFVETKTGAVLWIFQDRIQRAWFLHGILD